MFYLVVSTIAFVSYVGYVLLRRLSLDAYWYYAYLGVIGLVVILFRHYFKSRYGRDYTYGVVEEVKNDLVKVFVHDDMAANVKPGYYWVPAVPDAEPGVVVKLLVEERVFRSSRPIRILEVYLTLNPPKRRPSQRTKPSEVSAGISSALARLGWS